MGAYLFPIHGVWNIYDPTTSVYCHVSSLSNLHSHVSSMMTSSITFAYLSWKMVCTEPLIFCKLEVQQTPCEVEAMCGACCYELQHQFRVQLDITLLTC